MHHLVACSRLTKWEFCETNLPIKSLRLVKLVSVLLTEISHWITDILKYSQLLLNNVLSAIQVLIYINFCFTIVNRNHRFSTWFTYGKDTRIRLPKKAISGLYLFVKNDASALQEVRVPDS